ncbi:hypothetical protein [Allorhizocola rhizosphaerae]|uniref:hypothetical protein n=1 Tax=Allorhizocola rhizosphaerae TaxID=1872709 RepID=UPI000E3C701D|nr:hypothetical protein [Allorhizocola rhizosphaerae]
MTTWTRDLITSLIGLWIVTGVYIDGWAHVNLDGALETFFTPWHATFYSGLAVFFAWLGLVWLRSGRAFPPGYKAGAAGAAIFAAGGAFDMFWHELLGIETSIDALLSPPHLILLSGVLLMGTTAWRSQRIASAGGTTLPELISLTSVVAISAFFLNFLAPFRWAAPVLDYLEHQDESTVIQWIGGLLVFTALLLIPVLWQVRDGRYRAGTLTVFTLATGVGVIAAMSLGWDKQLLFTGLAGALIGAIAAELFFAVAPWRAWTYGLPIAMGVAGFTIWTGQFIGYSLAAPIAWPVALWAGSLLFAAGAGAALGAVAWRSDSPQRVRPDRPATEHTQAEDARLTESAV